MDSGAEDGAAHTFSVITEPFQLTTPTGTLHGTLTLPTGPSPAPLLLLQAGSGPTDRDGNSGGGLHSDAYKLLGDGLAQAGVALARFDKRGVGESGGAGLPGGNAAYTLQTFVDDFLTIADQLSSDARFGKLVLAGHSEGALIAILALEKRPFEGYVSLEGAGRPAGEVLRWQLSKQLSGTTLADANAVIDSLEAGQTVRSVPTSLAALFAPAVQPYLMSWFKYDPAKELASLAIPTLIIQGTTDIQVDAQLDGERLHLAKPDATYALVEGMNHVLKPASSSLASQNAAYTDPSLPLVPGVVSRMADFVRSSR